MKILNNILSRIYVMSRITQLIVVKNQNIIHDFLFVVKS